MPNAAMEHGGLQRESSFASNITGMTARTGRPRLMHQLSLIPRDPETDYMNKSFRLNAVFQKNLLEMMSENLELRFVIPAKSVKQTQQVRYDADSKERWKRLIHFLLNIDQAHGYDERLRQTFL